MLLKFSSKIQTFITPECYPLQIVFPFIHAQQSSSPLQVVKATIDPVQIIIYQRLELVTKPKVVHDNIVLSILLMLPLTVTIKGPVFEPLAPSQAPSLHSLQTFAPLNSLINATLFCLLDWPLILLVPLLQDYLVWKKFFWQYCK